MAARHLTASPQASRHRRRWLAAAAVVVMAALGFVALHIVSRDVDLAALRAAVTTVPAWRIGGALALTAISYLALTLTDHVALRAIDRPQPWPVSALGAFTGYAFSYNLGLSLLTGGSVRYRVYSQVGLGLGDVARVAALGTASFWSAVALLAGAAMASGAVPPLIDAGLADRAIGGALLLAGLALPLLRATGRRAVLVGRFRQPLPGYRRWSALTAASLIDLAAAAAALFVLLPGRGAADFPAFFIGYAAAIVASVVSHVPGGLGVFETVVLATVPGNRTAVFAGLVLYRLIYYLLPLVAAAGIIAAGEVRRLRRPIGAGLGLMDRVGRALAPGAVTLFVFGSGLVLLLSGALPGVEHRMTDLDALVPLPLVEVSHLGGSLVGTALLLVAPALNARLRSGLMAARPLLLAGALFSLAKGLDYEEATVQLAALGMLHYGRAAFYRTGGLAVEPVPARWLLAAVAALGLSVWAGLFAYKRVPYADDLWWHFAIEGDAPRFLRASFAAGILLACAAAWRLLLGHRGPAPGEALPADVAARALAVAPRTDAQLAFTGDKRFIVAAAGDAFLMYRVEGRTWVVIGDPVGPAAAWPELVWAIRRACDAAHGRLALYQISNAMLPLGVELGLEVIKYGEEARVDLSSFSLAGPRAKDLRHALRQAERGGLAFRIAPAGEVGALLPSLRGVSDAWLAGKPGRERRFSVGPFDPTYLSRFACALVECDGQVLAFANIWESRAGGEVSVDLMRHRPEAPTGTMDLLFARLLLWGQAEGYQWFNLGLAPLSGMPTGRLAPLWAKIGHLVFERGERFYGFTGLRAFKAKFHPDWQPRYVARPRGLSGLSALIGLMRVVNG